MNPQHETPPDSASAVPNEVPPPTEGEQQQGLPPVIGPELTAAPPEPQVAAEGNDAPPTTKPAPETQPAPSLAWVFMNRLAAIFTGATTPKEDLFEPIQDYGFDRIDGLEFAGVIHDQRSRELYSLAQLLKEERGSLRQPRKSKEVKDHDLRSAILQEQEKLAMALFVQAVKAELPKADVNDLTIAVFEDWRVGVARQDNQDGGFQSRLAEAIGLPPELIAHLSRRSRDEDPHAREERLYPGGGRG